MFSGQRTAAKLRISECKSFGGALRRARFKLEGFDSRRPPLRGYRAHLQKEAGLAECNAVQDRQGKRVAAFTKNRAFFSDLHAEPPFIVGVAIHQRRHGAKRACLSSEFQQSIPGKYSRLFRLVPETAVFKLGLIPAPHKGRVTRGSGPLLGREIARRRRTTSHKELLDEDFSEKIRIDGLHAHS